ncbi:MAG TPA: hypothetical protein VFI42_15065 [Thermomicrobiaceae bacterium]|nr:hypothetical protein [Thermomicrobiaceae bacterium]
MSGETGNLYRYEDILRAIGRYIDEHDLQDVVLVQLEQGILLRGQGVADDPRRGRRLIEYLFDAEELRRIDERARQQRGR